MKVGTKEALEGNYPIHFRWEMSNRCTFECPYCSHGDEYKKTANPSFELLSRGASNIAACKEPFHLDFFGGEPTLVDGYEDLVVKVATENADCTLDTVTNTCRSVDRFRKYAAAFAPYKDRVSMTFSYHITEVDLDEFIEKIDIMTAAGITVNVTNVIYPEMFDEEQAAYAKLRESSAVEVYNKFVYDFKETEAYTDEQLEWIESTGVGSLKGVYFDDEFMTINAVRRNWLNEFKGWKCQANRMFVIDQLGFVRNACKLGLFTPKSMRHNIYVGTEFLDMANYDFVVCKFDKCTCLDDLGTYKTDE